MLTWLRRRRFLRERQQLESLHRKLLEEARDLQRNGDIEGFAHKTEEAATVERRLDDSMAREQAEKTMRTH